MRSLRKFSFVSHLPELSSGVMSSVFFYHYVTIRLGMALTAADDKVTANVVREARVIILQGRSCSFGANPSGWGWR